MHNFRPLAPLALLVCACSTQSQGVFRDIGFDDALGEARDAGKIVMVDFFTTWCGPCKKLDSITWKDERVRAWLVDRTIALKIDAEKEADLAARFQIDAYPTILFVRPDGTEIDRLVGYSDPAEFLSEATAALSGKDSIARAREALAGHEKDPMARQEYGEALVDKGRYAEALEEYLWCFDHGVENRASYVGVRGSFLLGRIGDLAKKHPPARQALVERRDALATSLLAGKAGPQDAGLVAGIDAEIDQRERTLELYDELGHRGPPFAAHRRSMTMRIVDLLLEHRRYADLLENAADIPRSLEKKVAAHGKATKSGLQSDMRDYQKSQIVEMGRIYYEAYLGAERAEEADRIAEIVLAFEPSGKLCSDLVRGAIRAQAPGAARTLGERWVEKLPSAERGAVRDALREIPAPR